MKLKLVAVAVTTLLAAGAVNAAEVYNKDGNKLTCTVKFTLSITSLMIPVVMVIKLMRVWVSKVKLRLTTN